MDKSNNKYILFSILYRFLNNNKISHIPVGAFQNMPALKRLRLDNNQIVCDCSIIWLMKIFKHNKNNLQTAITCKYPNEMNGKNLINMSDKDFNCCKFKYFCNII